MSQSAQPYQPINIRQICNATAILDRPAGAEIATAAAGSTVMIEDLRFGDDGALYYRIDHPAPDGDYVAVADAPSFCGFEERRAAGAARFRATPNSCHMIAASRKTLDEVNAFAAEHTEFLPSMSVYRSENGWYAISLGQVSLAAAPALMDGAPNIPSDSYCSDGANYVAVMDLQDDGFPNPSSAVPKMRCGWNASPAMAWPAVRIPIRSIPKAILPRTIFSSARAFAFWAVWPGIRCLAPSQRSRGKVPSYHVLVTALPQSRDLFPSQGLELGLIACEAGLPEPCGVIPVIYSLRRQPNVAVYVTVLQGEIAACIQRDYSQCRDMLDLLNEREKLTGTPALNDDLFHAARIWAAFCSHFPEDLNESCRPVYRLYARLLADPDLLPERAAETLEFLRTGCDTRNPDACVLYSKLPAIRKRLIVNGRRNRQVWPARWSSMSTASAATWIRRWGAFWPKPVACRPPNSTSWP